MRSRQGSITDVRIRPQRPGTAALGVPRGTSRRETPAGARIGRRARVGGGSSTDAGPSAGAACRSSVGRGSCPRKVPRGWQASLHGRTGGYRLGADDLSGPPIALFRGPGPAKGRRTLRSGIHGRSHSGLSGRTSFRPFGTRGSARATRSLRDESAAGSDLVRLDRPVGPGGPPAARTATRRLTPPWPPELSSIGGCQWLGQLRGHAQASVASSTFVATPADGRPARSSR
jgi:hypothetical protein